MADKKREQYAADPSLREAVNARRHRSGLPCRGCGQPRAVSASQTEQPLCHQCRRAEAARVLEVEAQFRAQRETEGLIRTQMVADVRRGGRGSGRNMGGRPYRRMRAQILAESDLCGICGHRGALTVDHIIPAKWWPDGKPGFDSRENMQPAHGSMWRSVNPCPICGQLCNQAKGTRLVA